LSIDLGLQTSMDNVFLQSGFEETIVYTPSGGSGVSISAIVDRSGISEVSSARISRYATEPRRNTLSVLLSTTDVDAVVVGEDTVALKKNTTDTTNTVFTVSSIISQDSGSWRLGLT